LAGGKGVDGRVAQVEILAKGIARRFYGEGIGLAFRGGYGREWDGEIRFACIGDDLGGGDGHVVEWIALRVVAGK